MATMQDPARQAQRARLLALLADGDLDAALQAGLMDYPASPAAAEDAPLLAAQQRLRTAWAARERHRARAARLERIAAEREARRRAAAVPADAPASNPALPPAAAAALARARARAAAGRKP
ncbi:MULTISPECIES: hypothetical protein [Pseudoxanthomonas]|nr:MULTISPECIES: hypothetical protein [unclassified Pseudoxanthomonas]